MTVLAVSTQLRPLAFFDVRPILASASLCRCSDRDGPAGRTHATLDDEPSDLVADRNELAVSYELERQDEFNRAVARADQAELQIASLMNSTSWRATAPLRRVTAALRKLKAQLGKAPGGGAA